jgi:cell division protein FtsQ
MRRSSIHTARVLVFSGYIPDHIDAENTNLIINNDSLKSIRLLDDIYRISNYVCKDPVLQSLIGQVYCNENHEFILIPVLGKHKIVFGKAGTEKEVEDKFERLKVFYEEALPFEGWNKYTEISLKYEGQVVCRKVS